MRRTIRLREGELRRIISESVRRVLNEEDMQFFDEIESEEPEYTSTEEFKTELWGQLSKILPERNFIVLKMTLDGQSKSAIGERLGITENMVSNIYKKTINYLSNNKKFKKLLVMLMNGDYKNSDIAPLQQTQQNFINDPYEQEINNIKARNKNKFRESKLNRIVNESIAKVLSYRT